MTPQQRYRLKYPEKCRVSRRVSYAKNPKIERVSSDKWKLANRERVNKRARERHKENLEHSRKSKRVYQNRRRAKFSGNHTTSDLQDIWEYQDAKCFYCTLPLLFVGDEETDHFIPISLGGSNNRWNIVIACINCNRKKKAKPPALFLCFEPKWPVFWDERDGITKIAY